MNDREKKLIDEFSKVLSDADNSMRSEMHYAFEDRLRKINLCPTCWRKVRGTCWHCFESGVYDAIDD